MGSLDQSFHIALQLSSRSFAFNVTQMWAFKERRKECTLVVPLWEIHKMNSIRKFNLNLRQERMTSYIKFTPISGARNEEPLCYLLELDDAKILLDCGLSDVSPPEFLSQIKRYIRYIC